MLEKQEREEMEASNSASKNVSRKDTVSRREKTRLQFRSKWLPKRKSIYSKMESRLDSKSKTNTKMLSKIEA